MRGPRSQPFSLGRRNISFQTFLHLICGWYSAEPLLQTSLPPRDPITRNLATDSGRPCTKRASRRDCSRRMNTRFCCHWGSVSPIYAKSIAASIQRCPTVHSISMSFVRKSTDTNPRWWHSPARMLLNLRSDTRWITDRRMTCGVQRASLSCHHLPASRRAISESRVGLRWRENFMRKAKSLSGRNTIGNG